MSKDVDVALCKCGWPDRAVLNGWFPVEFDSKMGEYQLVLDCGERGKGSAVMHFCPWCGKALPKSRRGDYFTKPTEEDMNDMREKTQGITTTEQMLEVLGPPSETIDSPIRAQHTYRDHWESLELVVVEHKKLLGFSCHGKFKQSDASSSEAE